MILSINYVLIKKREEKKKKKHRCWTQCRHPQPPVMCWICIATCTQGFHCLLLVPWVSSVFPPPLLPRGPSFVQQGHRTSTRELCSFTQAPPGQSQGLDQGGRSGLQEEAGTPGLGREGRNARGPKVQFCILSLFHNLGQVTTLQKREERRFKKINEDSWGWRQRTLVTAVTKKKKKRAQSSSLGFGIKKRAVWVLEEICKESYCFYSLLSGNNNHNRISCSTMIVCVWNVSKERKDESHTEAWYLGSRLRQQASNFESD